MRMTELDRQLDSYLELRRAVGFPMRIEERLLKGFIRYAGSHAGLSTAQLAVDWACSTSVIPASRLSVVRRFLTWLRASDPEVAVPGPGLVARTRRPKPHIFSAAEIHELLETARSLGPQGSLRPATYFTLIGLLASCGLRAGEALRLKVTDVVFDAGLPHLLIERTKFRKSRFVPMHGSTTKHMRDYARARRRLGYDGYCEAFFVSEKGTPLTYQVVARTFVSMARRLGIRGPAGERGASLHCLRHTFAVSRVLAWYRDGIDVQACLPELSVYLGHVRIQESYWYLTATPELLSAASERFESYRTTGVTP